MSSDDFAARAAKLFGSLEAVAGAATAAATSPAGAGAGTAWHLNTQQGFAAGAEDQDSSEDPDAGPQSLPGAAGSDDDEDEYKVSPPPLCLQLSPCSCLGT